MRLSSQLLSARSADLAAKRAFDVLAAGAGLCVLALPLLAIAVLVRLCSPGPALFRQERIGRHGRPFSILKFRTMVTADGALITVGSDPRITRMGGILRRFKIDELPQLLNVVRGDMSLVGPRPEVPRYVALYAAEQREIVFSVRPGLTDPVSLLLIDEAGILAGATDPRQYYETVVLPWKIQEQVHYVQTRTFWGDLVLMWKTVLKIFQRQNSNWQQRIPFLAGGCGIRTE